MQRRNEIIMAVVLLIIGTVWFTFQQMGNQKGTMAQVRIDNEVVREIDLKKAKDEVIHIEGGKLPVTLEIKDHKIAFINAVCPDKVCQNNGFIAHSPQQSVCLPAHVSVTIQDN